MFRRGLVVLLVLAFIAATSTGIYALRQNNLRMLELREAVFTADKNDGDTASALSELQLFVVSHMNTNLPKLGDQKAIQLKYSYERRLAVNEAKVTADRAAVNAEATSYCQNTYASASYAVRSQCIEDYYAAHPVSSLEIPKELYAYEFVTPLWVPDTAGISLLLAAALFLVLLFKFVSWLVVRRSLKSTL